MSSLRSRQRPASPPSQGRLLLLGLTIALLGGAAALTLALLVGAVHAGAPTTTVMRTLPASERSAEPVSWIVAYRETDSGAVDISVKTTTTVATPFGDRSVEATALGSGFVLDGRGDILTAAHVVDGASSITVRFATGASRRATLLGKDDGADVAVIRVSPAGLTLHPLALGSSAKLPVGSPIAVFGDPLGFDRSLSTGVVSALDRTIEAPNGFEIAHSIQTDAAMNPGNSGGPLLNTRGQVVGIADQIAVGTNEYGGQSGSETSTGVGFAVPIDLIRHELTALEQGRKVTHAYLGIVAADTASGTTGALVSSIRSGSPAARAGVKAGDNVVRYNGTSIRSSGDLVNALADSRPGQVVSLVLRRDSTRITLSLRLGTQPNRATS